MSSLSTFKEKEKAKNRTARQQQRLLAQLHGSSEARQTLQSKIDKLSLQVASRKGKVKSHVTKQLKELATLQKTHQSQTATFTTNKPKTVFDVVAKLNAGEELDTDDERILVESSGKDYEDLNEEVPAPPITRKENKPSWISERLSKRYKEDSSDSPAEDVDFEIGEDDEDDDIDDIPPPPPLP